MPISQEQRTELESKITTILDAELKPLLAANLLSSAEINTINAVMQKIVRMENIEIALLWLNKLINVTTNTLEEFIDQLGLIDDKILFAGEEKMTDENRIQFSRVANSIAHLKEPNLLQLSESSNILKTTGREKILSSIKKIAFKTKESLDGYPREINEVKQQHLFEYTDAGSIAIPWHIKKNISDLKKRLIELKLREEKSEGENHESGQQPHEINKQIQETNQRIDEQKKILNDRLLDFSKRGLVSQVRELLEYGADPNYIGTVKLSVFDYDILSEDDYALEQMTKIGETPLTLAVPLGKQNVVALLLENGANATLKNNHQITPLELAIKSNNPEMVGELLKHIKSVNITIRKGETPLTFAIKNASDINSKKIIGLLIKHGADPAKKNRKNENPLFLATVNKSYSDDIINLFLEGREFSTAFASDLNKIMNDKNPLFHHTHRLKDIFNELKTDIPYFNFVIEKFCADPFIQHEHSYNHHSNLAHIIYPDRTPFQHILVLLNKGWSMEALAYTLKDASNELFEALILHAVKQNRIDILHAIFTNAADKRIASLQKSTINEIRNCIEQDSFSPSNFIDFIATKLKVHLANFSILHSNYENLLIAVGDNDKTLDQSNIILLNQLAEKCPHQNFNIKTRDGRSLLDFVYSRKCIMDKTSEENFLTSENKEVKNTAHLGETIFYKLLAHSDAAVLSTNNQSMLHIAIINNAPPSDLLLFILKGASPNTRDSAGKRPTDYLAAEIKKLESTLSEDKDNEAAQANYNLCILKKTILEKGADYFLDPENNDTLDKMEIALQQLNSENATEYQQCFKSALESYLKRKDYDGNTLLHNYILLNKTNEAIELLKYNINTSIENDQGNTALHLAIIHKNNRVAKHLLEKGASISIAYKDHDTALHIAAKNNDVEMMRLILEHHPDINAKDKDGNTVLHIAVRNKNIEMTNMIIAHRRNHANINSLIDINLQNKNGETALHIASRGSDNNIVEILLKNEADPNIPDINKDTPLKHAFDHKNKESAVLLLDHKADPVFFNNEGFCPFDFAIVKFSEDKEIIKKMLEERKIDGAILDRNLHYAAYWNKPDLMALLIHHGANPNSRDAKGNTALEIAIASPHKWMLEAQDSTLLYLLNIESTMITPKDTTKGKEQQENQLHIIMRRAINKSNYILLEKLLEKGANPNVIHSSDNKKYYSLLHAAADKNDLQLVKLLLKHGANPNIQSNHDNTPLHLTTNPLVAIALLESDANPNIGYHPINRKLNEQKDKTLIETLLRKGAYPRSWSSSVFSKNMFHKTSSNHLTYLLKKYPIEELPYYLKKTAYPELIKALIRHVVEKKRADILISILELCSAEQLAFLKKDSRLVNSIGACLKDDILNSPQTKLSALNKLEPHVAKSQNKLIQTIRSEISSGDVAATANKRKGNSNTFFNPRKSAQTKPVRANLLLAIQSNDFEQIPNILTSNNQLLNIKDDEGRTLLDIFYERIRPEGEFKNPDMKLAENEKIFAKLLTKIDINNRTKDNQTLLHLAAIKQAPISDLIIFLLKGANINAKDAQGKKPSDYLSADMQEHRNLLEQGIPYLFKEQGLAHLNRLVRQHQNDTLDKPKDRLSTYNFLKDAINRQKGIPQSEKAAALDIVELLSSKASPHRLTLG